MNVIDIKNVTKSFGHFTALKKVNLTVKKGEIHGFIGPNGAGKSTTIRILLGMLKADSGSISVLDQDAWLDAVKIHERVAYVPGEAKLWPNLTGGQVIDLLLEMRQQKINHAKRDQLIQYFDLDSTKKCRTYSKGNLQKVLIIAAFAAEADLYILDEPTSGLDPLMDRKFQSYLRELKEAGKTILLSSHMLSEVEKLCDSVSVIRQGTIIETGTLNELRHLTRYHYEIDTLDDTAELENIKGVHHLVRENNTVKFQVDHEATNTVLHYLSHLNIRQLTSTPPKLEDLFIRYYENPGDDNA